MLYSIKEAKSQAIMQNNEFITEISPHTIWEACEAVFVQLFMAGNRSEVIREGSWEGKRDAK